MPCIFQGVDAYEDTPYTILGRLCARQASGAASPVETEGDLITQADIVSISCKVFDATGTLINTYVPVKTDCVFDTLQTSGVFAKISEGGNFIYDIPATGFPTGNTKVRVELTVTLTGGEPVRALWDVEVVNLFQS